MSAISLVSNFLPPILSRAVHGAATAANRIKNDLSGVDPTRASARPDSGRLSPFAQVLSSLQQLRQPDPAKYKDVAQKIATNLQSAGQTAESNGDSASANLFNQLAGGFTSASKTGALSNVRDLAQAIKGHHRPHYRPDLSADQAQPPQNDPRDLLAAFKNNYVKSDAANPLAVPPHSPPTADPAPRTNSAQWELPPPLSPKVQAQPAAMQAKQAAADAPKQSYNDHYWASQPPEVQKLRDIQDPEQRQKVAGDLMARGFKLDNAIMLWGWDPEKTNNLRASYGYTWVPSAMQQPVMLAPGLSMPGTLTAYDPDNPPPGSIPVNTHGMETKLIFISPLSNYPRLDGQEFRMPRNG